MEKKKINVNYALICYSLIDSEAISYQIRKRKDFRSRNNLSSILYKN